MRIIEVPDSWRDSLRIVAEVTSDDIAHFLTEREKAEVAVLRAPGRRLERAASRIAGKVLLGDVHGVREPAEIEFEKRGDRPNALLRGEPVSFSISFTHSQGLGAAAMSDGLVGVDLEGFRAISREMTRFFLTADERASAEELEIDHALLHYWSAKEAAFKLTENFPTLLKVPLSCTSSSSSGLTFEVEGRILIETRIIEKRFVAALARAPGAGG